MQVTYETHDLKSIVAESSVNEKTGKRSISSVTLNGTEVGTSNRFWNSLYSRFGFGKNVFNYFTPAEVIDRITQVRPDHRLRFCVLDNGGAMPTLLAASNPSKPILTYNNVLDVVNNASTDNTDSGNARYSNGVVRSRFTPNGEPEWTIGGDKFTPKFDTIIPIDGYGSPEIVIGCMRLVCANGLTALSKVFSNKISGGSDEDGGLNRIEQAINNYGNDEGYDAIRRRLTSATNSYASVGEYLNMVEATTTSLGLDKVSEEETSELFDQFSRVAGNPMMMYGLVSSTSVGKKRLSTLPTRASVYDLINFGTEVSTHHASNSTQALNIDRVIGNLIGGEYDLEGSAKDGRDHIDVYFDSDDNK